MITRVFAQPYGTIMYLVENEPNMLNKNCFISILGSNTKSILPPKLHNVLEVCFDDILPDQLTLDNQIQILFTHKQAKQIIDFALKMNNQSNYEALYVHCAAGVSRSGAVAKFLTSALKLDEESFEKNNSHIQPNQYVLDCLEKCWLER